MTATNSTGSVGVHLDLTDRQRSIAFFTVLIAVVLEVADSTIVNTALPSIKTALSASPSAMQWIIAGYLLTLGSLLLLGGRLGDVFGHRRLFLAGVAGFIATSALCGLAQSPTQLIVARIAQGIAGAMMGPQTMAIVQLLYTPLERVSRLAWFGMIIGLAAIVGPIIGGLLIALNLFGLGWRLIFLINLPIGALALALGWIALPETRSHRGAQVDLAGAVLFATGFGTILLALIQGARDQFPVLWIVGFVAGVGLVALGWHRARRRSRLGLPTIIEPALFRLPTFRWGLLAALAFSSASIGFLLIFAVSLQQGLGLTPLATALLHIPFGLGVMLGVGLIGPSFLPGLGRGLPLLGGLIMAPAVVAVLTLIRLGGQADFTLVAALGMAGVGFGTLSGPLGPIVVAQVDRAHAGTASATLRTAQQLGGAWGIALVGAAYFWVPGQGAQTRLNGLVPGTVAIVLLLVAAIVAVTRLPANIFGPAVATR